MIYPKEKNENKENDFFFLKDFGYASATHVGNLIQHKKINILSSFIVQVNCREKLNTIKMNYSSL